MNKVKILESKQNIEGLIQDTYYIPIVSEAGRHLPIENFRGPTRRLVECAKKYSTHEFVVGRIGCGNKGYDDFDVAPFFVDAPYNMILPSGWRTYYQDIKNKK